MILATTALTNYWGNDEELLLAGEWCKLGNADYLHNRSYKVLSYPWDDRDRLFSAYNYINDKYNKILPIVVDWLNSYHQKSYSIKYWEIRLGLWLKYFLQISYDHYIIVNDAISFDNEIKTIIKNHKKIIPYNFNDFFNLYTSSHFYNYNLFCSIIDYCFDKSNIIFSNDLKNKSIIHKNDIVLKNNKFYNKPIYQTINNKFLYYYTGHGFLNELNNAIFNFMIPTFGIKSKGNFNYSNLDHNERETILDIPLIDEFDKIISKIIKINIPKVYLEDDTIKSYVFKMITKAPKYFITGNSIIGDEHLKKFIALLTESKTKIVIHQHGGQYGAAKFYPLEDHETAISDYYLTWGWKSSKNKIVPHKTILKLKPKKKNINKKKILIVSVSSPPYTKYFYSAPISSQIITEFNMLKNALENIKPSIRKNIYYRIKKEYGWGENSIINSNFPEIKLESTRIKLSKSMSKSSLCIVTYNATVFLESFSRNIPTILFWGKNYREIRTEASKYYDMLEDVGILHFNSKSFYKIINKIAENPQLWWNKTEIQLAKQNFLNYFCRQESKIYTNYKQIINNQIL